MNGQKFDKKKILGEVEAHRIKARKLIEDSVRDAINILSKELSTAAESYPLAVATLAGMIFKVEMQTIQAKAKIEQVAEQIKNAPPPMQRRN